MSNYRRSIEGNCYFFTVVTDQRRPFLCSVESRNLLTNIIGEVQKIHPFIIKAWVCLPDHLHYIWEMPDGDTNYSLRWALIKREFTKRSKTIIGTYRTKSRSKHREGMIWQRRFWEHTIRDEDDYRVHLNYIHYNPLKHRLVERVKDWEFSSFHHYVKEGIYPEDWCGSDINIQDNTEYE